MATSIWAMGAAAAIGEVDTGFGGGDGIVTTDIDGLGESAHDMAVDESGRIVVAGSGGSATSSDLDFVLARYHPDGRLDTSFGADGIVRTDLSGTAELEALTLDSAGNIVVVGDTTGTAAAPDLVVARYDSGGSLDPTFGSGGVRTIHIGQADRAGDVIVDGSGDIVVVGSSSNPGGDDDFLVVRLTSSGAFDPTFASSGHVTTDVGEEDIANAVALDSAGRILVSGESRSGDGEQLVLLRYSAAGSLDSDFGDAGIRTTKIGVGGRGNALTLVPDGGIVVAGLGRTPDSGGGENIDMAVLRYTSSGDLDSGFGDGGITTIDVGGKLDLANDVEVGPYGRIVATGYTDELARDVLVVRLDRDGNLDAPFGSGGWTTTDVRGGSDIGHAVSVDSNGDILVAGSAGGGGGHGDILLIKYSGSEWFLDDDASTFEGDIQAIAAAGITRGCNPPENDRFCPGEDVTRGEMAAFLARALGLDESAADVFVDDDASTFEGDIQAIAAAGITRGCNPPENDRFCPGEDVTRGEMAAFLARALLD